MKVFALAIGARDRASSRWRVWDHLDWLREQGHQVRGDSVADFGVKKADGTSVFRLVRRFPRWVRDFLWSDAILVQEALEVGPATLFKNLGKRRRLVFDFSDPIDRAGTGAKRRLRQVLFGLIARRADAIIVENQAYRDLMGDCRDKLDHFYGPVDAARLRVSVEAVRRADTEAAGPFRIGWTGSPGTLKFIAPLMPAIEALGQERSVELVLMGAGRVDYPFKASKLTLVDWSEEAEFAVVPTFHLGLFRLEPGEDALWRGAGKLFFYMAAGVPFAASEVGIARTLMTKSGIGFPVADDRGWLDVLRAAAADPEGRARMSERSLAFARDNLSYEVYRAHLAEQLRLAGTESKT